MDAQAKQQVADRIKQATNILVTVNTNPSVDQLAACIGLTLLLNKLDKHATAVFSGQVPSTIEFLQPEKTIETNTDSLRDFIISLDKAKADKLRYKVEDQFVRIFITPYRTSLTEKDLEFSQGDFNVEVVITLGVTDQKQLDAAITAHGRILHDATVVSVNAGAGQAPKLGQINWQDPSASSLSEMLVSISESFGSNLLDSQMATAFLTGIVSETERFSNSKTSPKVMTMSAQLMAAGANQQLIASKLEPPDEPSKPAELPLSPEPPKDQPSKPAAPSKEAPKSSKPKSEDGSLDVSHKKDDHASDEISFSPNEIQIDNEGNLKRLAEIASQKEAEAAEAKKQVEDALAAASPTPLPIASEGPAAEALPQTPTPVPLAREDALPELNPQTPNEAAQEAEKPNSMPGSHALLTPHNDDLSMGSPFTANTQPEWQAASETQGLDTLARGEGEGMIGHAPDVEPPVSSPPNLSETSPNPGGTHVDSARNAVESALASNPFNPGLSPVQALNAVPVADNLHSAQSGNQAPSEPSEQVAPVAPPPIPPPLTTAQGLVIPGPYTPAPNPAPANNNLSSTL